MEKVKSLSSNKCPHCGQDILVEFDMTPPNVIAVLTNQDITNAKNQVLEALRNTSTISEEEKERAYNWVMSEDTIFGPGEVDAIIHDIQNSSQKDEQAIQ